MATPVQFDANGTYTENGWSYHPQYGWTKIGAPQYANSGGDQAPQQVAPNPDEVPNWMNQFTDIYKSPSEHSPGGAAWMAPAIKTLLALEGAAAGAGAAGAFGAAGAGAAGAGEGAAAAGAAGASAAPAGASWGLTGGAFGTGGAATSADLAAGLGYGGFGTFSASGAPVGTYGATDYVPFEQGFNDLTMPGQGTWAETPEWGSGAPNTGTPMPDPTAGYTGPGVPSIPGGGSGYASQLEQLLGLPSGSLGQASTGLSTLGGAFGGGGSGQQGSGSGSGSGIGGLLGSLLGGGLGYLDARSQPSELTVTNKIDPNLSNAFYGQGGLLQTAQGIYGQQQNQPNYLGQAGQQISGMANTLPGYNEAVANNKGLWDSNPWVTQQQTAITDLANRNLLENVLPNVNSGAQAASGYGGSRQGIAQAKAISDMNTNLAPALTGLASSAYENSQNRALQGAGTQLNYGLNNQAQQAGLLATGAGMQQSAPWANFNQLANFTKGLPGGSSTTTPLFTSIPNNVMGGASLGGQIGSSTNWGDIFKGIGGIGNWLFGGGATTPPTR